MADNFLERHQAEYEKRKQEWLRRKKHLPRGKNAATNKPERGDTPHID